MIIGLAGSSVSSVCCSQQQRRVLRPRQQFRRRLLRRDEDDDDDDSRKQRRPNFVVHSSSSLFSKRRTSSSSSSKICAASSSNNNGDTNNNQLGGKRRGKLNGAGVVTKVVKKDTRIEQLGLSPDELEQYNQETAGYKSIINAALEVLLETCPPFIPEGTETDVERFKDEDIESFTLNDKIFNPEMSWLAFNWRVLAAAADENIPAFERLRFLAISGRNLDEFFAKRVGALKRQESVGVGNLVKKRGKNIWSPRKTLEYVSAEVEKMSDIQAELYIEQIAPSLADYNIRILSHDDMDKETVQKVREWYHDYVEPILDPRAIDPCHPFPFLPSLSIALAVELEDAYSNEKFAVVSVPSVVDRWIDVGEFMDETKGKLFLPLEQILEANMDTLFQGCNIRACHAFRVCRNADVERNEEEAEDLLEMMSDEVRTRRFASFVRLEVQDTMPEHVKDRLMKSLELRSFDVTSVPHAAPLGFGVLDSIDVSFEMDDALVFDYWSPRTHPRLVGIDVPSSSASEAEEMSKRNIFDEIKKGDILVHHPYHSFATSTQAFFEAAARDKDVLSIKSTLYRTSSNSPIISSLIKACDNGKNVAVLVELKARFDEERNLGFAERLETAGCNVAYGVKGVKTHCKATLVVRREGEKLVKYVHLGTGNYNPSTAGIYTDYGMFTCKEEYGEDAVNLFKFLMGHHFQKEFNRLLVAPQSLQSSMVDLIENEITAAKKGYKASITAKMNGLDDPEICKAFYRASQAGVSVNLIVRGICRIRPGVPGISENIRVISIIGRFLEHHRCFRFENALQTGKADPKIYMGSADLMRRNLLHRVEVVTLVEDERIRCEIQDMLDACLVDGVLAWELGADGRYHRTPEARAIAAKHSSQDPGKGKLMPIAATKGLHASLMVDVLKKRSKSKTKQSVAGIAAKNLKYAARMPKQAMVKSAEDMAQPEKLEKAESAFPVSSSSSSSSDKRPSMHEIIDANARPIEEEKVINDTSEDSMDDVAFDMEV